MAGIEVAHTVVGIAVVARIDTVVGIVVVAHIVADIAVGIAADIAVHMDYRNCIPRRIGCSRKDSSITPKKRNQKFGVTSR